MKDILVIDDNLETAQVICEFLKSNGFRPFFVDNPLDSINLITLKNWGAIICDIRMPQINGVELSKILKEKSPHTKIFLLSGYIEEGSMNDSHEFVEAYLEKPNGIFKIKSFLNYHLK